MKEGLKRLVRIIWFGCMFLFLPKRAYDLMVLIRGPDIEGGDVLKKFFTQRLRGFLFGPTTHTIGLRRHSFLTRQDVYKLHEELALIPGFSGSAVNHYLQHATAAMDALLRLPLLTKEEEIELLALHKLATFLYNKAGPDALLRVTKDELLKWFDRYYYTKL